MNRTFDFDHAFIGSLVVGPLQTNVYVLGCTRAKTAAVIDAGGNAEGLLGLAADRELPISKILQTHAHIDHVGALGEVKARTGAPIYLHPDDMPLYQAAPQQGAMFGIPVDMLPPVDHVLEDGQAIEVGELSGKVMLLPGHSPGSVAFWFDEIGVLFGGDVLFAGSIGRVDLPGGDPAAMKRSLARLIDELPDDARVLSGHGPETTIAMEKKRNPFLIQDW